MSIKLKAQLAYRACDSPANKRMRRSRRAWPCVSTWTCVLAGVIVACAGTTVADSQDSKSSSPQPLQEVTVSAHRLIDERTLDQVILPRFVKSHGAQNFRSHQLGRWRSPAAICPSAVGLKAAADEYLARRILAMAASVGAPTAAYGHCRANVEIIFTEQPQEQVTHFGKTFRALLGNEVQSQSELLTFSHAIRAWYTTATHTFGSDWSIDEYPPKGAVEAPVNVQPLDSASRLSVGMISGFANVLVIVDARKTTEHSLKSIADYIAMLVLTRTSLDGCSELPSIIDLLSADCAGKAPPDAMTEADIAYLKALYSANLGSNFNVELGEMRDRMRKRIAVPADSRGLR